MVSGGSRACNLKGYCLSTAEHEYNVILGNQRISNCSRWHLYIFMMNAIVCKIGYRKVSVHLIIKKLCRQFFSLLSLVWNLHLLTSSPLKISVITSFLTHKFPIGRRGQGTSVLNGFTCRYPSPKQHEHHKIHSYCRQSQNLCMRFWLSEPTGEL